MTLTELLEIVSNGENSGIEFKRDDVHPEDLAKEIVAFANFKGGKVFLGVEDNRTISGLTKMNPQTWVMDTVFGRYIDPVIIPYYEEIVTQQGRVAIITVSMGTAKPYAVKRNDRADIYIRIGDTSRLATREQIIRMAQESGLFHSEILPVSGSTVRDVNLSLFIDYYKKNYEESLEPNNQNMIQEKLRQLDLIIETEPSGLVSSIAGQVLFGNNPGRFLRQTGCRLIHYNADIPEINALSDETVTAPLAEMKNENDEIILPGLLSIIMEKLQSKISKEQIGIDHLTRERIWEYPPEVLRELIVNSLVHRDYTKANQNRIEIFSDRIEITSFGSLPNLLTVEKIKAGQQYPRNPIMIRVVKDYGFIDDRGLGIRRRVLPLLSSAGFPDPIFDATEDYVKIIVKKITPE